MSDGLHPLSSQISWEEGGIEDGDAKFGKVVDCRKDATGGGDNAVFQAEVRVEVAGDDRASKFGFAGWSAGVGRSHAKGFEDGFMVDGGHGFACDVRDCDPKQYKAVVAVDWTCSGKENGRKRAFVGDEFIGGTRRVFDVSVFEIPAWSQCADV